MNEYTQEVANKPNQEDMSFANFGNFDFIENAMATPARSSAASDNIDIVSKKTITEAEKNILDKLIPEMEKNGKWTDSDLRIAKSALGFIVSGDLDSLVKLEENKYQHDPAAFIEMYQRLNDVLSKYGITIRTERLGEATATIDFQGITFSNFDVTINNKGEVSCLHELLRGGKSAHLRMQEIGNYLQRHNGKVGIIW